MVKKFLTALAVILAVCIPICIYAGEDPVYGDVNGDGAVNSKDLTRLMKYVAGENVEIYGGDINGDGTVNAKDLTRLMKYISGDITKPVCRSLMQIRSTKFSAAINKHINS